MTINAQMVASLLTSFMRNSMKDEKEKVVSINKKAEKIAEQTQEAKEEAMADLLSKVQEMIYEGHVEHLIVITQNKESCNTLLAAGNSDELNLYKMYHYLNTRASSDYDFGIQYIMGELEEYDE